MKFNANIADFVGRKHDVIGHEFRDGNNNRRYCRVTVQLAGDDWAEAFYYAFFMGKPEQEEKLEANFPKSIYLATGRVETPEPFFRYWEQDAEDGSHLEGDLVVSGNGVPLLFTDLSVTLRCTKDGVPATKEDPIKFAERTWRRGLDNGSISPLSTADAEVIEAYESGSGQKLDREVEDPLEDAESADDDIIDEKPAATPPAGNNGGKQFRGNGRR